MYLIKWNLKPWNTWSTEVIYGPFNPRHMCCACSKPGHEVRLEYIVVLFSSIVLKWCIRVRFVDHHRLVFGVLLCRSLFVPLSFFLLVIVLSALQFVSSDCTLWCLQFFLPTIKYYLKCISGFSVIVIM